MARVFPAPEYEARLARIRRRMEAAGLDLLVITDPASMNYLTGYDAWSFYVPQAVLLPISGAGPVWVGREMDAASARLTTSLPDPDIVGYADHYVESPVAHPMQEVARVIRDRGWGRARIGVEMDAHYFTARSLEALRSGLPEAGFGDAYLLVNWLRTVKSPAEIEVMRQAARIVERAIEVGVDAVAVGVRECDAAARISFAQAAGTDAFGGDCPANPPTILSGPNSGTPHASWSDSPFEAGSTTCLELSGCRFRYHAAMSRTVYLGTPPPRLQSLADAVAEGMEAALAEVRPGAICQDVEAGWRTAITRHGFHKPSRIGYSIGIGYPPNWADHTASLRPGDLTVLEPNMTFHLMLGMWMDGWGYELSDTFRVTDDGVEVLTRFPRQLFVKS